MFGKENVVVPLGGDTPDMTCSKNNSQQVKGGSPSGGSQLNSHTPIVHLYLNFDSILPSPRIQQDGGEGGDDEDSSHQQERRLPPPPDLRSYTSPLTWPLARKNLLLLLSCLATFLAAWSAGSYSPPAVLMAKDLGVTHLATMAGITTFCAGFALAPMALAPISEIWGRYPVFSIAGVVYVTFTAVCSSMTTLAGMLVARFLVGVGGSVFSSIVGGVLADLWNKEDRNAPMAIFSGAVLAGTGAGPLVASVFAQEIRDRTLAWKWNFWQQAITNGVLVLAIMLFFKESRAPVLLTRKAAKLNRWYEELEAAGVYGVWVDETELSHHVVPPTTLDDDAAIDAGSSDDGDSVTEQEQRAGYQLKRIRWVALGGTPKSSLGLMIKTSISRPFVLLLTEPVVFCFSLWAAFSWGVLYLSFAAVPYLYSLDLNMTCRVYVAMIVAAAVATVVGVAQEELMKLPQWQKQQGDKLKLSSKFWAFMRKHFPVESPEARLYFSCITALFLPVGLFVAFLSPLITPGGHSQAVGFGFATWGIYSVYLATFNYLADMYSQYASSALAAQSFCRNLLGGIFPLLANFMFQRLGLKGSGGLLGGIATILTLIPWVLVFFGERIRARSKIAISLQS